MEGIKCINFIEIDPVVIEIQEVENDELVVPVNNTLVHHTAFLGADTQPCVLIILHQISPKLQLSMPKIGVCPLYVIKHCSTCLIRGHRTYQAHFHNLPAV